MAAALVAELQRTGLYVEPGRYDRVFKAARAILVTYNRRCLAHFTNPSHVAAMTTSPTTFADDYPNTTTFAILHEESAL